MILTLIYLFIATLTHLAVVFFASSARKFLEDERKYLITRRIMAVLLVVITLWFLYETNMEVFE